MPAQPTAQIAVQWAFDNAASDPTYTVLNFARIGSAVDFGASDLDTLIDDIGTAWSESLGQQITDDLTCVGVTARQVMEGDAFTVSKTPAEGTWLNVDSAASMPPWECVVVNHASTAAGRRGIGRTYLPGIRQSYVDSSGTVADSIRILLAGEWDNFREALDTITIPVVQVVYSRTYDSVATVLSSQVRPLIGIQRDRRSGSR